MDTFDYDPRMARLPMMSSPIPTLLICLAYLTFVKILGPALMRDRKPYDLRGLLIVYNFTIVIASAWMFHKIGKHGWYWRYSWTCANVDYLETEDSLGMVEVCWFFFLSKFVEMADTVFFILRKKYSQITFLHVVHHALVPITCWYGITLNASGYNTLFGFLNTFTHIWTYLYYGLAALGPSMQEYLWWKKYITKLQLSQFCLMTLAMISVMVTPGCKVSWTLMAINLGQALFFLVLYGHFYRNSYKSLRKEKSPENGSERKLFTHSEKKNGGRVNKKNGGSVNKKNCGSVNKKNGGSVNKKNGGSVNKKISHND